MWASDGGTSITGPEQIGGDWPHRLSALRYNNRLFDEGAAVGARNARVKQLLTTFGETYQRHLAPTTDRLHGGTIIAGAATGRATGDPNLRAAPRDQRFRCVIQGDARARPAVRRLRFDGIAGSRRDQR